MLARNKSSEAISPVVARTGFGTKRITPTVTSPKKGRSSFGNAAPGKRPRGARPDSELVKKRKRRPGNMAIREIRRLQSSTDLLIPKLAFARVVKDVCGFITPDINK
jgi:histone H3-like centromeric protein A